MMEFLTVAETAQVLKVSPLTIRRYIADGRLPAVKVGKGVRVRKEAVDRLAQPIEPKPSQSNRSGRADRPMTADDPLSKLVGSVADAPPTDASKKYEYLADAFAPKML